MRNAFINTVMDLAVEDERINVITADLGYSVLEPFQQEHPKRFFNVGISEQAMASIAAGIALSGKIVITYSIGNFSTLRCIEQIRNDICYHNANVKIVAVGGGFAYGQLGMSHHATEDIAMMRALPNMRVFVPADPEEAVEVTRHVLESDGPCYIRLAKNKEPVLYEKKAFVASKIQKVVNFGGKIAICASGPILNNAIGASKILGEREIAVDVYSIPCVKPLDAEQVQEMAEHYQDLYIIEDHNIIGGLGSAFAEIIAGLRRGRAVTIHRMGLQDKFTEIVGDYAYLCDAYGLSAEKIAERIAGGL